MRRRVSGTRLFTQGITARPHAVAFPHFLIIGAMKCGTTSLYRDLAFNPRIFLPREKEPNHLAHDWALSPEGRAEYAALFRPARPDQLRGEASTAYSTLPDRPGVPRRALEVCGRSLRIIYLVREPVARIISHHHHMVSLGAPGGRPAPPDIDTAVRTIPQLLDWTRYAMQIAPWLETFGPDQVRIVRFERYTADRRSTVAELSRFLGAPPAVEAIDPSVVHHRSENNPIPRGRWRRVMDSRAYHRLVIPRLPLRVKDFLRSAVLPKAPPRPAPPSPETTRFIRGSLAEDQSRLAAMLAENPPDCAVCRVRPVAGPSGSVDC